MVYYHMHDYHCYIIKFSTLVSSNSKFTYIFLDLINLVIINAAILKMVAILIKFQVGLYPILISRPNTMLVPNCVVLCIIVQLFQHIAYFAYFGQTILIW